MSTQMNPSIRRKALRTFRQRGVIVHAGSLELLFSAYETLPDLDFSVFLDSVFALLTHEDASASGILTLSVAQRITERLQTDVRREHGNAAAALEVIDIFTVPSWEPHAVGGNIFAGKRVEAPPRPIVDALPRWKSDMFRMRYELLKGKTLRNPKFCPPANRMLGFGKKNPYYQLTGVESLAGNKEERLVLGMLTQLEEGSWFLEDLNGTVRLDLSMACVTAGLHTECSFVIAQGRLIETDGEEPLFRVSAMGTPPCESREDSLNALSKGPNLFGGRFEQAEGPSLLKLEKEAVDAMFLVLSDVALDSSKVFAGLRHIFQGYLEDGVLPKMIVFMGNFLSHPFGQQVDDVRMLSEKFSELGRMIATEFQQMAEECVFVIIPGTNDPGPGNVLPRPPMPMFVMKGFIEAIGEERVHLGTNPCRIRYMTQEIVLLRDDLIQKMVRHCAVKPEFAESGKMSEHFVKTVVDQANLCPLPSTARPVLWRHSHSMWLFPLPHVVIIADKVDGYICRYGGTLGLNPGSFATDFSFQVYLPAERRAQQCSLDSEQLNGNSEEPEMEDVEEMREGDQGEEDEPEEDELEKAKERGEDGMSYKDEGSISVEGSEEDEDSFRGRDSDRDEGSELNEASFRSDSEKDEGSDMGEDSIKDEDIGKVEDTGKDEDSDKEGKLDEDVELDEDGDLNRDEEVIIDEKAIIDEEMVDSEETVGDKNSPAEEVNG